MPPNTTAASIAKLNALLSLPATGVDQDWEILLADADRLGEFSRLYDDPSLDDDDRRALMSLLVASVDDYLQGHPSSPPELPRIAEQIVRDGHLHRALLDYWAQGELDLPDLQFSVSPVIRDIRRRVPVPHVEPIEDPDRSHPVATAWRSSFAEIVRAFVRGDYVLSSGVPHADPVSASTADHIRSYIADYGETLIELPPDTWSTSVAQWYGSHWQVLVDLWTLESGRSDMVLDANVYPAPDGFRIAIHLVYVP
jgi:hypothetical protein